MPINLKLFREAVVSEGLEYTEIERRVIHKVIETIGSKDSICVEFGAYGLQHESNVFKLWSLDGWHAILIEGDKSRYRKIISDYKAYQNKHQPLGTADIINAYVSTSGDNSLDNILSKKEIEQKFDLLIIDVDGMDYHIWKSLTKYTPRVVMIEYNPTIPPHISLLGKATGNRVGCGILDLFELGNEKGYDLVACTGVNAIFVAKEESHYFSNRNDLKKLLSYTDWNITYVINTYDGGCLFSKKPKWGFNPLSSEHMNIDNKEDFWIPVISPSTLFTIILKNVPQSMVDFVHKIKNMVINILKILK